MQTALNFNQETKHRKVNLPIDLYVTLCNRQKEKSTQMLKSVTKNQDLKAKKPSLFLRIERLLMKTFLSFTLLVFGIAYCNGLSTLIDMSTQFARSAFQLVVGG
jgi:hypothetical protein